MNPDRRAADINLFPFKSRVSIEFGQPLIQPAWQPMRVHRKNRVRVFVIHHVVRFHTGLIVETKQDILLIPMPLHQAGNLVAMVSFQPRVELFRSQLIAHGKDRQGRS